jgi:transposase, IS6 family
MDVYCAVDSDGHTIDFYLNESRDKQEAKLFFKKILAFLYVSKPLANNG